MNTLEKFESLIMPASMPAPRNCKRLLHLSLGLLAVFAVPNVALAHHAIGAEIPATVLSGLLSGIAHPVIGVDHLAFVIGLGLLAARWRHGLFIVLVGCVASVLGSLLIAGQLSVSFQESFILASLVLIAILVVFDLRILGSILGILVAALGLAHGAAFGEAVMGIEPTPMLGYAVGFFLVQFAIATAAMLWARAVSLRSGENYKPRIVGGVIAGVALVMVFEQFESWIIEATRLT